MRACVHKNLVINLDRTQRDTGMRANVDISVVWLQIARKLDGCRDASTRYRSCHRGHMIKIVKQRHHTSANHRQSSRRIGGEGNQAG